MTHAYLYFLSVLAGRTLVVFIALIVGLRLFGKRQIGQINIYDLAMIMAIANAVQNAMTSGNGNLSVGFICAGTLFIAGRILASVFLKLPRLEHHLVGAPTLIINNGKLSLDHMERECLTEEQVLAALRQHGLTKVSEVRLAVLEVDGSLSIVPKD
jgi:uncharacterized membrane protein YcaP (DUF421 family)